LAILGIGKPDDLTSGASARPQVVQPPSVIGPRTRVLGTISGDGPLTVRGSVEGKIALTDRLTLAPGARVQAEVQAGWVEIHGLLRGSLRAQNWMHVAPTGRFEGDAVTPKARIALGAIVRGGLLIRSPGSRRPA
jgi:cytoskeletal protein CcmA (bactofilin family)